MKETEKMTKVEAESLYGHRDIACDNAKILLPKICAGLNSASG